jgi:hypothetical protein
MTGHLADRYRTVFLIVAAVFVILGTFNLLDQGNNPYDGYVTDGNNAVIRVDTGSPAERAGLKVGDRIRSIDSIPVEDRRVLAQQGRPRIGQATTLVVERREEGAADAIPSVHNLSFDHAAPPGNYAARRFAAYLIGLCFIGCGLVAYFRVPNQSGTLFALTGLCLGASFLGTPYFSSNAVRTMVRAIISLIVVFGFAFLFHLMLEFPKRKALLRKRHALKLLYAPALLVALFLLFLVVVQPQATSGLNQWSNLLIGLFIVVYFGGAAVAIIHSYAKATSHERAQYGLHIELSGILLGVLPVTIALVFRILVPRLALPGSDFYYLTVIFIPIALATAILRQLHAAGLPVEQT